MRSRSALLAATLLTAVSGPAFAQGYQHPKGFYVGAALGGNFLTDSDLTNSGSSINNQAEYKIGPAGALSLGWAFGNGLRTEIEGAIRHNNVDKVSGTGASGGDGDMQAYSLMLNLLYDINTGTPFTPYIGAGIGWAYLNANDIKTLNGTRTVDDSDNRFAYQGMIGVAYSLSPQWKLSLDYRYFATLDPSFDAKNTTNTVKVDSDYNSHAVMLGLRYHFWTPAAAPAPATPAAPPAARADIQRSFLVFFDFNKSDITAEAARVIQQAADHAKRGGVSRIIVTGHTDTSGSPQYNQRLSERRAANVREALVRQGLAANSISTVGKGESDPLVKTGDGVREPQNRRAEIVLQ
ncbi:MAG: OmpA family protein [Alphaproteobacteria bacterium]|nr:OmpA family protein [Alphaproteobacteria bacterium]